MHLVRQNILKDEKFESKHYQQFCTSHTVGMLWLFLKTSIVSQGNKSARPLLMGIQTVQAIKITAYSTNSNCNLLKSLVKRSTLLYIYSSIGWTVICCHYSSQNKIASWAEVLTLPQRDTLCLCLWPFQCPCNSVDKVDL